jgi:hypothetical protein
MNANPAYADMEVLTNRAYGVMEMYGSGSGILGQGGMFHDWLNI